MAGWFELDKSTNGQYRFILKAGNGETILTSELYTTKNAAENGIHSVQTNSPLSERYELKDAAMVSFILISVLLITRLLVPVRCIRQDSRVIPELHQ